VELAKVVADLADKVHGRLYGKYRGFVVDNQDPKHLGRLKVRVPSVFGDKVVTDWALPCLPYGGHANQGFLCIPEVKASVWIEFEKGDRDLPVWVGTFWSEPGGESEIPTLNDPDGKERKNEQAQPTRKILKTKKGHTIQFEDADQEEMVTIVEATHKHVVTLNKDGIQITDGVNGNTIIMGQDGIQLGSSGAHEHFVLGDQFMANVKEFVTKFNTHKHILTVSPPVLTGAPDPTSLLTPQDLQVPLSAKHKVE